MEHDGGLPRRWAEAAARLSTMARPQAVSPQQWTRLKQNLDVFLRSGWATRAEALGWAPDDVLACDREAPEERPGALGLLWFLGDAELMAMTAEGATIRTPSGAVQRCRRVPLDGERRVAAWELGERRRLDCALAEKW